MLKKARGTTMTQPTLQKDLRKKRLLEKVREPLYF
jgi:hypothetical protein